MQDDGTLAKAAAQATVGLTTTLDKVKAIHRLVVEKTRYVGLEFGIHGYKPYKSTQVFQRRFGDCKDKATLIMTLLRSVGVDSELVLLRTRRGGRIDETPASLAVFDHAIAYVPALDLYLDGTAEFSGLASCPPRIRTPWPCACPRVEPSWCAPPCCPGKQPGFAQMAGGVARGRLGPHRRRTHHRWPGGARVAFALPDRGRTARTLRQGVERALRRRRFGRCGDERGRPQPPGHRACDGQVPQMGERLASGEIRLPASSREADFTSTYARLGQRRWPLVLGYPWRHEEQVTYAFARRNSGLARAGRAQDRKSLRRLHPGRGKFQGWPQHQRHLGVAGGEESHRTAKLRRFSRLSARHRRRPGRAGDRRGGGNRHDGSDTHVAACSRFSSPVGLRIGHARAAIRPGRIRRRPGLAGLLDGKSDAAAASFARALAADPSDARALFGAANLAFEHGDPSAALGHALTLLEAASQGRDALAVALSSAVLARVSRLLAEIPDRRPAEDRLVALAPERLPWKAQYLLALTVIDIARKRADEALLAKAVAWAGCAQSIQLVGSWGRLPSLDLDGEAMVPEAKPRALIQAGCQFQLNAADNRNGVRILRAEIESASGRFDLVLDYGGPARLRVDKGPWREHGGFARRLRTALVRRAHRNQRGQAHRRDPHRRLWLDRGSRAVGHSRGRCPSAQAARP
jgi:hypothetical protein